MLSTVHTYKPTYYAPFALLDYPRPLLCDEQRDPRHGYWNVDTSQWADFKKNGAFYWIKFTYDHKRGDITFTLLYDKQAKQAVLEMGPESYWDKETRAAWRYNAKYIPHSEDSEPTLRQTLCDIGFTDDEIAELHFNYEVDDFIELTYNEKTKQENPDDHYEDYDY
jgi:hypothetical protein